MKATIQKQSIKQDIAVLLLTITIAFVGYLAVTPHYLPAPKIE